MYNIIVISKASMGARGRPYGLDGLPFKKQSSKLTARIKTHFTDLGVPVSVSVDNYTGDLELLKKDGASLILLSPYIAAAFIPLSKEEDKYCLVLSEETFLGEDLSPIAEKLKSL